MTKAVTKEVKPAARTTKPNITVAEYINAQINLCGKSQFDIARECGFKMPNIISMIKQGKTKLPLDKIVVMATSLGVDPIHLLKLALNEYLPGFWNVIEQIVKNPIITNNEMGIMEVVRQSNVPNPKVRTETERIRILDAINKLKPDNAVPD